MKRRSRLEKVEALENAARSGQWSVGVAVQRSHDDLALLKI